MKKVLKPFANWPFRNRKIHGVLFLLLIGINLNLESQIANYVSNGGFEELLSCSWPPQLVKAKCWRNIDSTTITPILCSTCSGLGNSPFNGNTFQWARTGNNYCLTTFFCDGQITCVTDNSRIYLRNRLKQNLEIGRTYCVKFYVNICNTSTYGMDGFAAYFSDNSIDTILKTSIPLTYLKPQVQNPNNNIISDTLNWVPITGTFVATGIEKHMLIGNFKNDTGTNTVLINPNVQNGIFTDVCVDDVSCIDIDLPAYAGPDTYVVSGGSVYIGRPQDVGIDEACKWYKLPNTSTPIATAAGLWVKPVTTSTYIVVQDICGNIKSDTVVVWLSGVGITELNAIQTNIHIYPIPANESLTIQLSLDDLEKEFTKGEVLNNIGQMMKEVDLNFKNKQAVVDLKDLPNGVYQLVLKSVTLNSVSKRFVVAR